MKAHMQKMSEKEIPEILKKLTDDRESREESIPYVASLLSHSSLKVKAKALWLLGESGLEYPSSVKDIIPAIALFLESPVPLLRQRALNALGRCGRGCFDVIEPYFESLFGYAEDEDQGVRHAFIWAMENIAVNTHEACLNHMDVFVKLLQDENDKVRMEAPEIFRVIGRRNPDAVMPYIPVLQKIADTDENRVVRIHSFGAIRAVLSMYTVGDAEEES